MSIMDWSPSFSLGVKSMDDEHKQLISIMNRLHDENARNLPQAELLKIIDELVAFTLKHFADEEKYMADIQFPELDRHKLIHQDLLSKLKTNIQAYRATSGPVPESLFDFLRIWLSAHIQGVDMKYGEFSRKKSA